jgi:hypothetical protein
MIACLKRLALALAVLVAVILVAAAVPIVYVETGCGSGATPATPGNVLDIREPGYRRAEGDSYLTYPEWYIVHAYADLAGVTRQSSESGYDYLDAVTTFWSSLCGATETARRTGPVTLDQRVTNYIIGVSFSLEMAVQGLYERSIGALTAWLRGEQKTPEDAFNQRFLDEYAAFLEQVPWYQYPFKQELTRFWRETPWAPGSRVRSAERRVALSLEYGLKDVYAVGIGALAGYSPADLTIMSVIKPSAAAAVKDVTTIRALDGGLVLVGTPRYRAYTNILREWANNGTAVVEIAGNRRILTTVLAPARAALEAPGGTRIFVIAIQAKPGWERLGFDTDVAMITRQIIAVERQGAVFEHAYDY